MASLTVENYVKTIALIADGETVGTGELAAALNVSPGTVTGMLKTLSEANLATYTPYEGARLTPAGLTLAMKVIRRHRLLELFLVQTLNMPWDEVHRRGRAHGARGLGTPHRPHRRLSRLSGGRPARRPDPPRRRLRRLDRRRPPKLPAGQQFRVVRVVDQDPAFLRYLTECGLDLKAIGRIVENRPEAGALVFHIRERRVALGHAAADKVLVVAAEG